MESGLSRTGDVELGADQNFQTRWWRLQRACWVVMLLLVGAGLAGLFGHGPLAQATIEDEGGKVRVSYERLARYQSTTVLKLSLDTQALHKKKLTVRLSKSLVDPMRLQQIMPQPESVEPIDGAFRFTFRMEPGPGEATLLFLQKPNERGWVRGEVQVDDLAPIRFAQLIFP